MNKVIHTYKRIVRSNITYEVTINKSTDKQEHIYLTQHTGSIADPECNIATKEAQNTYQ